MNYVGQLAGQVFVQVKELYRGLNPATLSGCIDIIVVRQPDGTLQCSPFHVRFGKMGVLRSREKVVDIEINGEPVSLHMKLGENGEAFFVRETENDQEVVPSYLATSPIMSEGAVLMGSQLGKGLARHADPVTASSIQTLGCLQSLGDNGAVKKRRKRRRKFKVDSVRREENGDYSEDEDMFPIDLSSDEDKEPDGTRGSSWDMHREEGTTGNLPSSAFKQSTLYACSDGDWTPLQSKRAEHTAQACTLSLLASGGLSVSCPLQTALFQPLQSPGESRPSTPKSDSELVTKPLEKGKRDNPQMLWAWGELPQAAKPSFLTPKPESPMVDPASIPVSDSTHFRVISGECAPGQQEECPPPVTLYIPDPRDEEGEGGAAPRVEMEGMGTVVVHLMPELDEVGHGPEPPPLSKTDSPSKKKDKRSRHLGADGVYLDDITELEPEVAALYFPKSEGGGVVRVSSEGGARSTSLSPQSASSSGVDSGVDSYSDQIGDLPSIAISLCGGLTDNREITKEQFQEKEISYLQFAENPSLIDDPNLVVKIGTKYYNWTTAAPLMLAMQAFQKPLPKATVENIMKEKMPKKGGRWWFSWRGRNNSVKLESPSEQGISGGTEQSAKMPSVSRRNDESSSSDEDHRSVKPSPSSAQSAPLLTPGGVSYKKTLRLTSEQLISLQLKDGANDVVFSVTTQYQGTCRCEGTIYLWSWDDKIVISDIDGTITRSDTLGHILPTLGKDWTHQGIARLFHKVSQNGYKFLYCSARAIGMADMTRGYLHWVNERGTMLPQGPVLLSPSSLFSALHREVIEKKPEKFKVECLTDIKNIFYPNTQPFYAAFGNRPTDVYSYKEVGVPLNRIFTVNPKGELVQEHAKTNISSYVRLGEVVDHVFPLLMRGDSSDFPCSDTFSQFTYWREQLPEVEQQQESEAHRPMETNTERQLQ
ncbi:phosphatidate phosphatase LPIN1 isoform X3 [Conger conger]|nr:phosphatidate phosphatase LPIN1 isoform X3 [Conger conger]XP_061100106.1 phosphatidate phosphatase LPIN1 isoform X3 [Conger conger]XP_061100107.1 phosphatidate phosphatase LPIN1 isoform X3 [Conger conger]